MNYKVSGDASELKYRVGPDILSGNTQPLGSNTLSQMNRLGAANVESAIRDLQCMIGVLSIGSVITNTDGVNPTPRGQISLVAIKGTATAGGIFNFYGIPVAIESGFTAVNVKDAIKNALIDLSMTNAIVSAAIDSNVTENSIEITHLDSQTHNLQNYSSMGIDVEFSMLSPAKDGFGTWSAIGRETKTFDGTPVELFYFKRTS